MIKCHDTLRKAVCAYLDHRARVKTCSEQSMDHERYLYASLISFTITKNNSNVYFIFITLLVSKLDTAYLSINKC